MSVFKGFIYKNRRGLTLLILLLVSFSLMFFSNRGNIQSVGKVGFSVFSSFQNITNTTGSFVKNTIASVSQLKKIEKQLKDTRNELEQYKKIIQDINLLKNENNELRKLKKSHFFPNSVSKTHMLRTSVLAYL